LHARVAPAQQALCSLATFVGDSRAPIHRAQHHCRAFHHEQYSMS
jgi:hypothetical protein